MYGAPRASRPPIYTSAEQRLRAVVDEERRRLKQAQGQLSRDGQDGRPSDGKQARHSLKAQRDPDGIAPV